MNDPGASFAQVTCSFYSSVNAILQSLCPKSQEMAVLFYNMTNGQSQIRVCQNFSLITFCYLGLSHLFLPCTFRIVTDNNLEGQCPVKPMQNLHCNGIKCSAFQLWIASFVFPLFFQSFEQSPGGETRYDYCPPAFPV